MLERSYGVIPFRDQGKGWEVLLIQNRNGRHWGFPKGKGEAKEDPFASACRELSEETGLTIETLIAKEPIVEKYSFERDGKKVEKSVAYYLALCTGKLLLQEEEMLAAKWVPLDKAGEQLTFAEGKQTLQKSRELLKLWRQT